jgi:hypothetical protein
VAPLELQIGTDPFFWVIKSMDYDTLAGQLAGAHSPVVVPVTSPLQGRLVLSKAAGSVALGKPDALGWNPSDSPPPAFPVLYTPSGATPTAADPGFWLDTGTDVKALEQKIVAAMSKGGSLSVPFWQGMFRGQVVLHGATLPYAVVCPQAPTA